MTRADDFHRIADDLYVWEAYEPAVKCELTSTALRVGSQWILIDPIKLAPEPLAELADAGDPAVVICTNGNHTRAAGWYRHEFGLRIFAHADAAAELEVGLDGFLVEGQDLRSLLYDEGAIPPDGTPLEVCTLPGAGSGEIAIVSGSGVVCVGDALIHLPATGFGLLPAKYCSDAKLLHTSVRKLLRWQFHILTFAHGLPLTTHAHGQLSALLD